MAATPITVEATLQPDGMTLHLKQKLALPPGQVMVTVHPTGPTILDVLDRIHRYQQRRGRRPMTEEEMAAEVARMRAEDEESEQRWRQIRSQTGTRTEGPDDS